MIRVDIKIDDRVTKELNSIQRQLRAYPQEALAEFKSLTPIARVNGGNARRRTTLKNDRIEADYPYATRLDQGWSKQAPQGMTKPFEQWVRKKVKQIFGK
jgi:hypothetical protein